MSTASPALAGPPRAAAPAPLPSPWILGWKRDLLLFIASPLLIFPALALVLQRWAPQDVYLLVSAFGALGHHLPGMMRAYGDRALFRRFKTRFIVAPIFLVATCGYFAFTQPMTTTIVAYAWAVYHGAMQSHGFHRIYDSKRRSTDALTARLDQLLLFSWFAVGIFLSPTRVPYLLEGFYLAGAPVVPASVVSGLRVASMAVAALVTVAFVVNAVLRTRAGAPPNPVKILSLCCTIALWWFANITIENLLVGIVLFELFHDAQYLTIVWLFNEGRARRDPEAGAFTRWLFGQGAARIPVYLGFIAAYGSLVLVRDSLPAGAPAKILAAVLTASAFLHFYYDGFIWKLRERQTSAALGLDAGREAKAARSLPGWAVHGAKWALFVVPLALLAHGHHRTPRSPEQVVMMVAESAPKAAQVQWNLAQALQQRGDLSGAIAAYRRVLERERWDRRLVQDAAARLAVALVAQAEALLAAGDARAATPLLQEAAVRGPELAGRVTESGIAALEHCDLAGAGASFTLAAGMTPGSATPHLGLARVAELQGRIADARVHALRALAIEPRDPGVAALAARVGARP